MNKEVIRDLSWILANKVAHNKKTGEFPLPTDNPWEIIRSNNRGKLCPFCILFYHN